MRSVFFLDYSACFDTLSRSILHDILERHCVRGVSLDFIRVYFANISQYVCYDAVKSSTRCQKLEVLSKAQQQALFFFDICSCDFERMCSKDESILYANDTVLII